jgi:hypothetical protein
MKLKAGSCNAGRLKINARKRLARLSGRFAFGKKEPFHLLGAMKAE